MSVLSIILGILTIICGIALMFTPLITFMSTGVFLIILFFIQGVVGIIVSISEKNYGRRFIFSIFSLILGVLGMVIPGAAAMNNSIILILTALWLLVRGVLTIVAAIESKRNGATTGIMVLGIILGVLDIILGIYSFAHPMVLAISLGILIGFYFIDSGVNMIVLGTCLD